MNFSPFSFIAQQTFDIVRNGLQLYVDAGLTSSYPGTGTTWYDISGEGNDLTLINGPLWVPLDGKYFLFDGGGDYVSSLTMTNPSSQLTFSAFVNYTSLAAYFNIFDNSSAIPMTWVDGSGNIEVNTATGLTSTNSYSTQTVMLSVTIDSVNAPGIAIYINGLLVNSTSTIQDTFSNPLVLTLLNRGGSNTFNGKIFNMMFYNRVLSASEILQNYNALMPRYVIPPTPTTPNILMLDAGNTSSYPGTGTVWYDISGYGNAVSLINGPTFTSSYGGGIVFDGSNDYLSSVSLLNPNGEITMVAVLNYNSQTYYRNIFDKSNADPMLWIDTDNKLEGNQGVVRTASAWNTTNPIFIGLKVSSSSTTVFVGQNDGTILNNTTASGVSWANPSAFTLLNRAGSLVFGPGTVYILSFYNSSLTSSELLSLYSTYNARYNFY